MKITECKVLTRQQPREAWNGWLGETRAVLLNALDSQHMGVGGWDLVKETLDFKMATEEFGSVEVKKD